MQKQPSRVHLKARVKDAPKRGVHQVHKPPPNRPRRKQPVKQMLPLPRQVRLPHKAYLLKFKRQRLNKPAVQPKQKFPLVMQRLQRDLLPPPPACRRQKLLKLQPVVKKVYKRAEA